MRQRGRCGLRPLAADLPGARTDAEGPFVWGRDVCRGTGPDLHGAKLRRCPVAMSAAAQPVLQAWRHHAEGVALLTPTASAPLVEAVALAARVGDRARALARKEAQDG